ncbi:MAG: addiction module toxin, HicA family [Acidobacteria bacterium]|nr:MAG: addiction module toxin, HicA family [Acidobacteriota bacterium]
MTKLLRLKGRELIAVLRKAGFEVIRVKGSHHFLRHPDGGVWSSRSSWGNWYSDIAILTYGVLRLLAFAVALWFGVSLTERADIRRDIPRRFGLFTLLVEVASPKFSLRYAS